jgi:hypothetical protein
MERAKLELVDRIPKSTLNLNLYIQQRDVRNMIWRKLSPVDWKLVLAAHSRQTEEKLIEDEDFWIECAIAGYLNVLKWIFKKLDTPSYRRRNDGFGPLESRGKPLLDIAFEKGHLHISQWMNETIPDMIFDIEPIRRAVDNNHSHVVEWLIDIGVLEERKK